ncbi:MAG: M23 family metallopeptidase [Gaiellales bacterium]
MDPIRKHLTRSPRRLGGLAVVTAASLIALLPRVGTGQPAAGPTVAVPGSPETPTEHAAREARRAYGWPIRPFDVQHPVRGFFGDPRISETNGGQESRTLHFGIDIACPNGTPVYAVVSGVARLEAVHPETVAVVNDDGRQIQSYWHIRPAVSDRQRVVARRTILGYVKAPWAHVHFADFVDGRYLNPLRPGALGPYRDTTVPTIRSLTVEHDGRVVASRRLTGAVDLVIEAADEPPLDAPAPWAGLPVAPAALRWRLLTANREPVAPWTEPVDFRTTLPASYGSIYAKWTRQNKARRKGRYRFYVARALETATLTAGRYLVEVEATDTRGNRRIADFIVVKP